MPKSFKMVGKIDNDYIGTRSDETSTSEDILICKVNFEYED